MPAHILVHNPEEEDDRDMMAAGARICAEGGTLLERWSLGTSFKQIRPGGRLFFYRSSQEPRGIFAVGVALPANADVGFDQNKEPVAPGRAAYKADGWRKGEKHAHYVKVEWEMMVNPYDGDVLIPRERLIGRSPVFNRGPEPSGTSITNDEVARVLYEDCCKAWGEFGFEPNSADSDGASFSARQMDPKERKDIEDAAVAAAVAHYAGLGCEVVSREKDNVGWDLDVLKDGKIFRRVEVKGTKLPTIQVELSPNEYEKSGDDLRYRLAVVRSALDDNCACAIYDRRGGEWLRVPGKEGGDKSGPKRLEMVEKRFAIIRQPE